MSRNQTKERLLDAEAQVFAHYSLNPHTRRLRLEKPALGLRVVEFGAGEPALFLHGFSLCTAHWAPLISRVSSLHSLAIDMPGHGMSDGVDYRGVELRRWFKEMLTGCLDKLGLESAHIIGHSQGAMLGLWLVIDAPERVRSLVAIGTPAVAFGARLDGLRVLASPGIGRFLLAVPKPASRYRRILADTIGIDAVNAAPDALVRATYLATRGAFGQTVSSYLREMFTGARDDPPRYVLTAEELRAIRKPVLIIWGEKERHQPIEDAKKRVGLIPRARFEVVPGGHEPWLGDPDACAGIFQNFVSGL